MPLQIIRNDITKMKVDAIVSASDSSLSGSGGADGSIHRAAGPELPEELRTLQLHGCTVGNAVITRGFRLPCRYIIHTAGPKWEDGLHGEHELLASCYRSALALAAEHDCRSIAFPLISSGVCGYPRDLALRTAVDTISDFLAENDMTVYVVVFDRKAYRISEKLFADIAEYIDDNYADEHYDEYLEQMRSRNARQKPAYRDREQHRYAAKRSTRRNRRPASEDCPDTCTDRTDLHETEDFSCKSAHLPGNEGFSCGGVLPSENEDFLSESVLPYEEDILCQSILPPGDGYEVTLSSDYESDDALPSGDEDLLCESVPLPGDKAFVREAVLSPYEDETPLKYALSLNDALEQIDESFSEMLMRKIDESGMSDSECYKKANIDRKLFSKIRSDKLYKPSKPTVLAFAIALELPLYETKDMLMKAGFALSHSSKFDIIVEYFIERGNYNIFEINEALFAFDQRTLGA